MLYSMELNGSRKGHMRSIWTFTILRKKSVKKKCRHWNRRKNISQQRMKVLIARLQKQGQISSSWKKKWFDFRKIKRQQKNVPRKQNRN